MRCAYNAAPVTQREVRSKRRKLIRMLYFLSAHRVEDGMVSAEGTCKIWHQYGGRPDLRSVKRGAA